MKLASPPSRAPSEAGRYPHRMIVQIPSTAFIGRLHGLLEEFGGSTG